MSTVILRDFSFTRDFHSIAWKATLLHNLLRSFCAGLVFTVFYLIAEPSHSAGANALLVPFIIPIGYLFMYLPLGIICGILARVIPFIGLITFVCAFFVAPGDPLVWAISLVKPEWVPMHKPPFFSMALIIWLLKGDEVSEVTLMDHRESTQSPPPLPSQIVTNPNAVNKI